MSLIHFSGIKINFLFLILLALLPEQVLAEDPFIGIQLSPSSELYLVLKDVNVRAKPMTKSRRVGRLKKNERVIAIGKAKKTQWIAVKKGQKKIGFVYGKALLPIVDGSLIKPIINNIVPSMGDDITQWPCHYQIKFIGKAKIERGSQITSDYDLAMECDYKNKTIKINSTMFLTELPYLENKQPIFQINVDLFDIPIGAGDMFSTTLLYNSMKNKLVFDRVNKESLKSRKNVGERKVTGLRGVLIGAVEMAYQSWGPIIWSELSKTQSN
jgi:hypothetical protein